MFSSSPNATSVFQRKQMTTSGADNVFNIALEGSFDDCQTLVKKHLMIKAQIPNINSQLLTLLIG